MPASRVVSGVSTSALSMGELDRGDHGWRHPVEGLKQQVMADPVKKDDALAFAMREAFQRHMENAASAARSSQRPAAARRDIEARPEATPVANAPVAVPPAPARQAPVAPPPVNDVVPPERSMRPRARIDQIDVRPDRGIPGPAAYRSAPDDFAPNPGADLAQRARDAVLDIEPHRSAPRLRHPEPVNDSLRPSLSGEDEVAMLERPAWSAEPAERTAASADLPVAEARAAEVRGRSRSLKRVLLSGLAVAAIMAALVAAAGTWLLREPPSLGHVISVVRGMWVTHSIMVPLQPVSQAPVPGASSSMEAPARAPEARITVARAPSPDTTSKLLATPKSDMLRLRHVQTESVKLDPVALAVQDAADRLAAGNLAAARLILEQYRGSGDARALFALARTFDPAEQPNPDAQDRKQAEALYEEAARKGSQQSAEHLARLRIGTN